jgi:hypothetical protein
MGVTWLSEAALIGRWRFSPPGHCVGNLSPAIAARKQVGIGLSYRPASLRSLATQFQTRFLESIPRPIAGLKFPTLVGQPGVRWLSESKDSHHQDTDWSAVITWFSEPCSLWLQMILATITLICQTRVLWPHKEDPIGWCWWRLSPHSHVTFLTCSLWLVGWLKVLTDLEMMGQEMSHEE